MIELPDGSKRTPTKEEILAEVKRKRDEYRLVSGNGRASETTIRTDSYIDTEDRHANSQRPGTPFKLERRNRVNESYEGSGNVANGRIRSETGPPRGDDGRIDEYNERSTASSAVADSGQSTTASFSIPYQQQVKRDGLFTPYKKAFKDAFTNKKKSSQPKKPNVTYKLINEVEAKTIRDDLINIILIQSEHADAFIIATTKGHDKTIIIWSDIDKKDAAIIADFMLSRAKKDPRAAKIVRELMTLNLRLQLAEIVLPRAYRSLMIYIQRGISIY